MKKLRDNQSDDMGRATRIITPLELQLLIPHVADILSELQKYEPDNLHFSHCFELSTQYKTEANLVIATAKLPGNVQFYQADSRTLFEIRGASGGIVTSLACYLYTK
jgi:hypothetical protein